MSRGRREGEGERECVGARVRAGDNHGWELEPLRGRAGGGDALTRSDEGDEGEWSFECEWSGGRWWSDQWERRGWHCWLEG